ncbi:hypothetical protein PRIPAC_94723 [Pristionchus pacificus]|uniref:Uncharacterized protein n=1 Tax=Pristionchus pacificus TaxID=54126 RepID=A0A2A6BB68_PRIPA|nr:hypothetical protein PRIPAC_94723 [Pristionchus pacificus]|eukprot:PDM63123.1 hypothetical protein PRIPAC_50338 [Pristionchus pacificus]
MWEVHEVGRRPPIRSTVSAIRQSEGACARERVREGKKGLFQSHVLSSTTVRQGLVEYEKDRGRQESGWNLTLSLRRTL